VPVIGDFQLMAMMLQQARPEFSFVHGGIVSSHDIVGQRLGEFIEFIQCVQRKEFLLATNC
jgi:hypothetical protein